MMTVFDNELATIAALDLDPIKVKLMHEESGEGWTLARANAAEFEYRRFLHLMKKFPQDQAAPSMEVDTFWHYHILDTLKYAEDCQTIFGYFLHHFPYVGLRGEDDLAAHHRVGERMRVLYEETFGETYPFSTVHDDEASMSTTGKAAAATAFSMTPSRTAFSMSTAGTAFSMSTAGTAFSMTTSSVSSLIRPRLPH